MHIQTGAALCVEPSRCWQRGFQRYCHHPQGAQMKYSSALDTHPHMLCIFFYLKQSHSNENLEITVILPLKNLHKMWTISWADNCLSCWNMERAPPCPDAFKQAVREPRIWDRNRERWTVGRSAFHVQWQSVLLKSERQKCIILKHFRKKVGVFVKYRLHQNCF